VGGSFTLAGGVAANRVAKWDGTSFSALGSGLNDQVAALTVFDDGGGLELYTGGYFTAAGGGVANSIAKWDGSSWSALDSGMNGPVTALAVFDDGSGPALYAGGDFTLAGGAAANHIAKWNGSSWSALDSGTNGPVAALTVFDDGGGLALYAGGYFTMAGGAVANHIAKWGCPCTGNVSQYCTPSTTKNGCMPTISSIGTPSGSALSGYDVTIIGAPGNTGGFIFYGVSGPAHVPWGTGFKCVKSPIHRTWLQNSGGTHNLCDGMLAIDFNDYMTLHPDALGGPFVAGETFWMQGWLRDPGTPAFSNALTFTLCP
jgi:hypothetical protein